MEEDKENIVPKAEPEVTETPEVTAISKDISGWSNNNVQGIDPEGDITLKCCNTEDMVTTSFLVSSHVLRLASPVFKNMLKPNFKEGDQLLMEGKADIKLNDDEASLLSTVLHILHFHGEVGIDSLDAEKLARLAILCDKYDLTKALGSWITVWFQKAEKTIQTPKDYGFMLLAAYRFNESERFREISIRAIKNIPNDSTDDWKNQELLNMMPHSVHYHISNSIRVALGKLVIDLQNVELSLTKSTKLYETGIQLCSKCSRELPNEAKKCHPCSNTVLIRRWCSSEMRIADFFAKLRKYGLWPTPQALVEHSVSEMVSRIKQAQDNLWTHKCVGYSTCPLKVNFEGFTNSSVNVLEHSITGVCLKCIKEDGDWDDSKHCTHGG
ncbi:hypothetical protein DM02DRAFT_694101 [Periconia macrospinosa]|uniref:BTB domain-containing protein n=1 Tax=Periconia macrospinosa TaxID=97972 RepID=A0A2V1D7I5_9PLEO|nr:hypothetical protein DM02DRAFT_694101 [Periconia macrospinosa]